MSIAATSSLFLPSVSPQTLTLTLCKSFISPSPSPFSSFSSSPLRLRAKNPFSVSPSLLHCCTGLLLGIPRSHFALNVALSSEFGQEEDEEEEEVFGGGDRSNVSPDLKLFVGNLPFNVDSSILADLFQSAGKVQMVEVIYDKMTERSRGFGFVTMSTPEEVEVAAQQFNGYELEGRPLRVNFGPPPPRKENQYSGRVRGGDSFDDSSRFGRGRGRASFYDSSRYGSSRGRASYDDDNRTGRGRGGGSFGDSNWFGRGRGGGSFEDDSWSGRGHGRASFDDANRVYVGNLAWGVDDLALETLFSKQGEVVEAKVVYDRETGRSRGFGFVTYRSAGEVNSAIDSLNGADLDGRAIRVSAAVGRQSRQF